MINNILSQLERDEGKRGSAYQDSLGYWTIAIGVCIDARKGCALTEAEIQYLTNNRITSVTIQISQTWPWTIALDPVRFGVLQNMVYQMGVEGVAEFKQFLSELQAGDYEAASVAMLDSLWAKE